MFFGVISRQSILIRILTSFTWILQMVEKIFIMETIGLGVRRSMMLAPLVKMRLMHWEEGLVFQKN